MSVSVMAWVWAHSTASGNDRLVLLCLADEADDDGGNCYPSSKRIAAKCNIDKGTALDVVARLEAAGEIIVRRPERYGRGRHNRYVLVLGRDPTEVRRHAGWDDDPDPGENGGEPPPFPTCGKPAENGGEPPPLPAGKGGANVQKRWRDPSKKVVPAPPDPSLDPCYRPPDRSARKRKPADPLDAVAAAQRAMFDRHAQARTRRDAEDAAAARLAADDVAAILDRTRRALRHDPQPAEAPT